MVQQKKKRSCQRTNRLPISVQATQHSSTWARVMSNGIALHKMAEHNNNWYRERWNSWAWNGTESSETVQRGVKWISPRWNGTVFDQVIQHNIKWHSFSWNSLAYIQTVQPKDTARREVVQLTSNVTALREMVEHTSRLVRAKLSERKIFRTSSAMQRMKHSIWNNRVLHEVV